MKHITKLAIAVSLSAGAAHAGGVDRSGQDIGFIFEKGGYAALSYGSVKPTVQAVPNAYGDIANDYTTTSLAFKMDVTDKLSLGLIMDQPYGANILYPVFLDGSAVLNTTAMTALARYKLNDAVSLHGGISYTAIDGAYNPGGPAPLVTINRATDTGYVLGAAWEKPEIAARVALTYFSGGELVDASSNSSFDAPQAVNLDFQTGIAANTLVLGSVRWVDWSNAVITVDGIDVYTPTSSSVTYSLGVGRKFNDNWSGAVTVGYEAAQGGEASILAPTDGNRSIGLGVSYTMDNIKISGGVRFVQLGDASTGDQLPSFLTNTWADNTATAVGVKIAYTF
jgi:long-chain fatty acid transport protein